MRHYSCDMKDLKRIFLTKTVLTETLQYHAQRLPQFPDKNTTNAISYYPRVYALLKGKQSRLK